MEKKTVGTVPAKGEGPRKGLATAARRKEKRSKEKEEKKEGSRKERKRSGAMEAGQKIRGR